MRSKNASDRRRVLSILTAVRRMTLYLHGTWNVRSTVWVREESASYQRPRRQSEYPEHQPGEWARLVSDLDDMISGLTMLRQWAHQRYIEQANPAQERDDEQPV